MRDETIGVIGAGYVGLTTACCLAHLGHRVTCVDNDVAKVDTLRSGRAPIDEPGLGELVRAGTDSGRINCTSRLAELRDADVVFVCLPTPQRDDGMADLGALRTVLAHLSKVLPSGAVLVTKSTVPVGTGGALPEILGRSDVSIVSNPEFLREGHAVSDFLRPDRIVVGSADHDAAERVCALYAGVDAPIVRTDTVSAELAKYACNAFLAMKLSYVNAMAELCENFGADVTEVTRTMGLDTRIGPEFLNPGPGWGGSCLPKDTSALQQAATAAGVDFPLLRATIDGNNHQHARVVRKVRRAVTGSPDGALDGARIGLLGLAFKAGTADRRDSPALAVAARLAAAGAVLTGYDPAVSESDAADVHPVHVVDDPNLVAKDAAAIVVLTGWPEFRELDWAQLGELAEATTVVDACGLLDAEVLDGSGLTWDRTGQAAACVPEQQHRGGVR